MIKVVSEQARGKNAISLIMGRVRRSTDPELQSAPARLLLINLPREVPEIYDFLESASCNFPTFRLFKKLANKSHSKVNEQEKLVRHQHQERNAEKLTGGKRN